MSQVVVNPYVTLVNDNGTKEEVDSESGDINFSEEAAVAIQNLQEQVIQVDKTYQLQDGTLTKYGNRYFVLKGNIADYNGKVGQNLRLVVYDNSTVPSKEQNVSCVTDKIDGKNYEFRCTPTKDIKGTLQLSPMFEGTNRITLNMTESGSDYIDFKVPSTAGNSTNVRNNPIYKKSSSGLSGGAIAGIVIACAVVLIIASIVAMMLRKPKAPVDNSTSVVGLRTIDNYSE